MALRPPGYRQPMVAYLVEYTEPRQPGSRFQVAAFSNEDEALKLKGRLEATGRYGKMSLTPVPVHQTVQDWAWDR